LNQGFVLRLNEETGDAFIEIESDEEEDDLEDFDT